MVEDHVRRRDDEIVMGVLHVEQSLCQRPRPMIVDVREVGDAARPAWSFQASRLYGLTHQVAHASDRLGTVPCGRHAVVDIASAGQSGMETGSRANL